MIDTTQPAVPQPEPVAPEGGISTRTMEMVTALFTLVFGALVVYDSHRLGSAWGPDGPESGYFPFYVGSLICIASIATFITALRKKAAPGAIFVTWGPLKRVFTVLLPAMVYVFAVQYVGLYVASAVYIPFFMIWLGKYSILRSVVVGVGLNALFFIMFEVWFKVPLWKGTLDPLGFLGY